MDNGVRWGVVSELRSGLMSGRSAPSHPRRRGASFAVLGFATAAAALAPPQPASAFGPICVPVMANCFCTYAVPCPTTDMASIVEEATKNVELRKLVTLARELRDPQALIVKLATGKLPLSAIGIDAIGIDLSGFATGDLGAIASGLGLPQTAIDLAGNASSLGIDSGMISRLVSGDLRPQDFLAVAKNAGLDLGPLASVGLTESNIMAIAQGKFDPSALLAVAAKNGFGGEVLSGLGIDATMLSDIAQGKLAPEALINTATSLGLDFKVLETVGLDRDTVMRIAQGKFAPDDIIGLAQRSGLDTSAFSKLGIDARMIGDLMAGRTTVDQAVSALSAAGMAPGSMIVPGVGASAATAVVLGEPLRGFVDYARLTSFPLKDIPGLAQSIGLSQAAPAGSAPGGKNAPPVCLPGGGALVTVTDPNEPHLFPAAAAQIDALTSGGGDLSLFEEARGDSIGMARQAIAGGMARASFEKATLSDSVKLVDKYREMVDKSESAKSDLVANSTIKMAHMVASSEIVSLMTVWATVQAAQVLASPDAYEPIPLLPDNEKYARDVASTAQALATDTNQKTLSASQDLSEIITRAKRVIDIHNVVVSVLGVQQTVPPLLETIAVHEAIKAQRKQVEDVLRAEAAALYVDGPDAYERILPVLVAQSGSYLDGSKWQTSGLRATSLDAEIMAQVPVTRFGRRRPNQCSYIAIENGSCLPFETVSGPERFSGIDQYHAAMGDPIRYASATRRVDDGPAPDSIASTLRMYFALTRRAGFWGELRRGAGVEAMTDRVWHEFRLNAPQCLAGPYPSTEDLFRKRPDMFDVSVGCDHVVWAGGDAEDFILASEFGGTDAALWSTKVAAELARLRGAEPNAVRAEAQDLLDDIAAAGVDTRMASMGMDQATSQIAAIRSSVGAVAASDFSAAIYFPY